MINRNFVRARIIEARPDLSGPDVDRFIDNAVRLLANLIHYKNGANHEDEDVVTAALVIGQDIQGRLR